MATDDATCSRATELLRKVHEGDLAARDEFYSLVYEELRRLAHARLRREPGATLRTTDLAHEACLRLLKDEDAQWQNRRHFFGAAARAMERILVDHARRRRAAKRGAGKPALPLDNGDPFGVDPDVDHGELSEALEAFGRIDARAAEVVRLRYFLGLDIAETAKALDVSERTVRADWTTAKAWLGRYLSRSRASTAPGGADG